MLPASVNDARTQVLIADSDPVLTGALPDTGAGTKQVLRSRLVVSSLTFDVISVRAQGATAAQAENTANAVARSYIGYLAAGGLPGRVIPAKMLQPATNAAPGTPLPIELAGTAALGALAGALLAAIAALAISRSDRRLRERDEIAEAIGVPVLASVPVEHPSDPASWKKLLEEYEPGAVDAWRLRRALQDLGLADGDGGGSSLAVLSLSSDRKALALAPQLAVFAASLGTPAVLVIGPQQDPNATATLRAACAAPPRLPPNLQVRVHDSESTDRLPEAALAVVAAAVDGKTPQFTGMTRTALTVLGVTAGVATAEQLARVAASAAADGRHIAGILVADPEESDHTTGRLPQVAPAAHRRLPSRITGAVTETRETRW